MKLSNHLHYSIYKTLQWIALPWYNSFLHYFFSNLVYFFTFDLEAWVTIHQFLNFFPQLQIKHMVICLCLHFVLLHCCHRLRYFRVMYVVHSLFKIPELNLPVVASYYVTPFRSLSNVHYHITSHLRLSLAVAKETFFKANRFEMYFNVLHCILLRKTEIRLTHWSVFIRVIDNDKTWLIRFHKRSCLDVCLGSDHLPFTLNWLVWVKRFF